MMSKKKTEETQKTEKLLLEAGVITMLSPIVLIIKGLTLMCLWNWFLVPVGLLAITFPVSIGLTFFIGYLTAYMYNNSAAESRVLVTYISRHIAFPLFTLFFGWLLTYFI